jgi:MFS transporter, PPP family, 3-phenylpropionic acid transporter
VRGTLAIRLYYVAAVAVGGVYLPFFPAWLEGRGIHGIRLGIIAAAAPGVGVLAPTAFGTLADALRVRAGLLQLACAGALLTFALLAAAAAAGLSLGFGVLFATAVVFAVFRSPMSLLADVVALEVAPLAKTTYGRLRLWGSLGFMVAVPLATHWVDPRDRTAFPVAMTGLAAATLLASLRLPRRTPLPSRAARRGARHLWAEPDFRRFLIAVFLGQCGHSAYDLCFSLHLYDLHVSPTSFWLAWDIGTAAEVLVMAYSAPLFRTFSPLSLFAVALGAASFRWAATAFVRCPGLLMCLQPLHGLSFGLAWLAALAFTSRRFPGHSLATAQGLFATAMGAGSVVGMVTWGPVFHRGGGAMAFGGAACLSAAACAFAVALERRVRGRPVAQGGIDGAGEVDPG